MLYHDWVCLAFISMWIFVMNFWVNFKLCKFSSKKQGESVSSKLLWNRGLKLPKRLRNRAVLRNTIKNFFRKLYNWKISGIRGGIWNLGSFGETCNCDNFCIKGGIGKQSLGKTKFEAYHTKQSHTGSKILFLHFNKSKCPRSK